MVIPRWLSPSRWFSKKQDEEARIDRLLPQRTTPLLDLGGVSRRSKAISKTGSRFSARRRAQRRSKQARKQARGYTGSRRSQLSGKR